MCSLHVVLSLSVFPLVPLSPAASRSTSQHISTARCSTVSTLDDGTSM